MNALKHTLLISACCLISFSARAMVVTVGLSANCDYNLAQTATLQDAIDDINNTEIRITRFTVAQPVTINRPLILSGGFDDCPDAALGQLSQNNIPNATIDANGVGRPISITQSLPGLVDIRYLDLINGNTGTLNSSSTGGGLDVDTSNQADVMLSNVRVLQNLAFGGGGIYFDGLTHDTQLTLLNTTINSNTAENNSGSGFNGGGGLFITGGSLLMYGQSLIIGNTVTSNSGFSIGGGIFANNTALHIISGDTTTLTGIRSNQAGYRGGGLYLGGDVTLNIYGRPVNVNGQLLGTNDSYPIIQNIASNDGGGGIYAIQSAINATNVQFQSNQAGFTGGAIAMIESTLDIRAADEENCRFPLLGCNLFIGNHADFGGAIWANLDSGINISKTLFTQNAADFGTALNVGSTIANLESVIINNEALNAFGRMNNNVVTSSSSSVTLKYASIINNQTVSSVFNAVGSGNNPGNHLYNSIVYNPQVPVLGTEADQASNTYDCVLSDSPDANTQISTNDYNNLFINPSGIDFRLQPGAIAIDQCAAQGVTVPSGSDFKGLNRGYDDPTTINVFGTFDAGAHEFDDDLIFADEFEFF